MNFDFRQMKPMIQREFDEVLCHYPTDLSHIAQKIPIGGDAYDRKRILIETAAKECPVHVFPHYPFAFELDFGQVRSMCYMALGFECTLRSGVDFSPIREFRSRVFECNMGSFNDYYDYLHRTIDHDRLLSVGYRGAYEECEQLNQTETDEKKRRFRELIMACCKSVEAIGLRLKARAREMLQNAADEDARYNLTRIVNSPNTPWEPPVTLYDAMNTLICTTLFLSGLDGEESHAYGQLDRLLEPFFRRDVEAGRITPEEAYFLLNCLLHKTDLHCKYEETMHGFDNGATVMIGGCDADGKPVYNQMTDMILRVYSENRLINPKLNARASSESPRPYIEKLAALMQTGNNNIIVENDDYIIPMFLRMGVSPADARAYVGNGCQEVICPNQLHSRAFTYLNMAQVLLDTLLYTEDTLPDERRFFYRYGTFDKADYAALHASFLANLRSFIRVIAEQFAPFEAIHASINPEPMLAAFTGDCIASGRDIPDGGARYNHKTLSLVGFGTVCDSLLAMRRAYADGTQQALTDAVSSNFAGSEPLRQSLWNHSDKFGHSASADEFARALAHELAQVSRGVYNGQGIEWRTSLFTYSLFNSLGRATGATPDGRPAGQPLSRQMNMTRLPDLTTAALSMAALTEADFNDVGMFDIALPASISGNEAAHQALTDYIRTCISLKLPVLQTNVADIRMMQEERQHKGTHPDLVVRVCGYSAPFCGLDDALQDEIISRSAG